MPSEEQSLPRFARRVTTYKVKRGYLTRARLAMVLSHYRHSPNLVRSSCVVIVVALVGLAIGAVDPISEALTWVIDLVLIAAIVFVVAVRPSLIYARVSGLNAMPAPPGSEYVAFIYPDSVNIQFPDGIVQQVEFRNVGKIQVHGAFVFIDTKVPRVTIALPKALIPEAEIELIERDSRSK